VVNTQSILTLDWSALVGSGFVVGVLFLALVERLRRTFASQQELNGLGEKFSALQSLYLQVREAADEARERALSAQTEQRHQWERIAEQVIRPLERITERLDSVCAAQAAQAATLDHIGKRLDHAEELRGVSRTPARWRP
jgi:hypothetical protein